MKRPVRTEVVRRVIIDAAFFVGVGLLVHTVLVRVPTHLAEKEPASVPVLRLTAPDVAPSFERSRPLAGKRVRATRMNHPLPAAPDRN